MIALTFQGSVDWESKIGDFELSCQDKQYVVETGYQEGSLYFRLWRSPDSFIVGNWIGKPNSIPPNYIDKQYKEPIRMAIELVERISKVEAFT